MRSQKCINQHRRRPSSSSVVVARCDLMATHKSSSGRECRDELRARASNGAVQSCRRGSFALIIKVQIRFACALFDLFSLRCVFTPGLHMRIIKTHCGTASPVRRETRGYKTGACCSITIDGDGPWSTIGRQSACMSYNIL